MRCKAKTQAGKRCKNKAVKGGACASHPVERTVAPFTGRRPRCKYLTKEGKRCKNRCALNQEYGRWVALEGCERHTKAVFRGTAKKKATKKATKKPIRRRKKSDETPAKAVAAYRKAAKKLFGTTDAEAKHYIVLPKNDPGRWAGRHDLAVIYLEPHGGKWDHGTIPDALSYFSDMGADNADKLSDETLIGYIEYVNPAVAVVTRMFALPKKATKKKATKRRVRMNPTSINLPPGLKL